MAFSNKSWFFRITNDSSRGYAMTAVDTSYRVYNSVTFSWWQMAAPGINKNIWSMWEETGNVRSWLFSTQADGTLRTIFSWNGSSFSLHKTANAVFDNSWKHYMISFVNGVQTVYVNNVLQVMNETLAWGGGAAGLFAANQKLLVCAKNPSAIPIDDAPGGNMTNLSIWNVVLDASQRTELYNLGRPANLALHSAYANCTNWWRMDQSDTSPTLVDSKNGAASNMTITKSGTSAAFDTSSAYPVYSVGAGAGNIRSGTTEVADGDLVTGTLVVPTLANTKISVAGDGGVGTYDGSDRWTDPGIANVKLAVAYKANTTVANTVGTLTSTDPGVANVRLATAYTIESVGYVGTLVAPVAASGTAGTVDINNLKENIRYILNEANTTTALPVDLSNNLTTRVANILKVNPERLRPDAHLFPCITIYASGKTIEQKTIAKDLATGKRIGVVAISVVGFIWNDYTTDFREDPADEDLEVLMENIELVLRHHATLNSSCTWHLPDEVNYHTMQYDEQTHLRVGVLELKAKVYY